MPPTLQELGIGRLSADDRLALAEAIWASVIQEVEQAALPKLAEGTGAACRQHRSTGRSATVGSGQGAGSCEDDLRNRGLAMMGGDRQFVHVGVAPPLPSTGGRFGTTDRVKYRENLGAPPARSRRVAAVDHKQYVTVCAAWSLPRSGISPRCYYCRSTRTPASLVLRRPRR